MESETPKTTKQLEEEIIYARVANKLLSYAEEIVPKVMKGETIEGITIQHARYITNYLREFIEKGRGI